MNPKPYLMAAALLAAASFSAAGEKIDQSQLPAPVQQTLNQHLSTGTVDEITLRTEGGQSVYEVTLLQSGGTESRLVIAEDGSLVTEPAAAAVASAAGAPTVNTGTTVTATAATPAGNTVAVSADEPVVDSESRLALEEVPESVRMTIEREAEGREVADIDRETHEDRAIYEVEFREQGVNEQVHIEEDGTLVRDDGAIRRTARNLLNGTQVEDTPMVVQEVIKRELEGREIADIDKERRSGRVVYEIEIDDAEGQFQLHVAEDGTIVKDGRMAAE